ncbi:hypothetical protein GE061_015157, partial [Apolygus lucorum]
EKLTRNVAVRSIQLENTSTVSSNTNSLHEHTKHYYNIDGNH